MKITKRVIAVILCVCMVIAVLYVGNTENTMEKRSIFNNDKSLIVWYTDDAMTDYLNAMAVSFHEKYNIRVLPKLQSGADYIETIYQASVDDKEAPDLYIASNEVLEKAYLSGVASEVLDEGNTVNEEIFPKAALQAVTYQNKYIGYPYYFETSALLYNKTYFEETASNQLAVVEAEKEQSSEAETAEAADTTLSEADSVEEKVQELLPSTFDELLNFADEYDAPQAVEAVFKWDVNDIFYNYFFIGNYINIGGECGDDDKNIDIYNIDAIKAMKVYQDLKQFFSIDADDVAYDSVIQEFMDGKIVMTTATTDIIRKLDDAKKDGSFSFDYGLVQIPDLNDELKSRSLSVTNTVVVNGFSDKKENANRFAAFLVNENADTLYEKTGKIPSNQRIHSNHDAIEVFKQEYADSVPLPKMMSTSNYWVQLEITFSEVWNGSSVSDCLKNLSEQIMTQVTGEAYTEEYIEEPEEETESMQYLDEEAEKEAAQKDE